MRKILFFGCFLVLLVPVHTIAQSCSCGGTPLLNSLELPATLPGYWQFALTYDYNNINDTYEGTKKIETTRERITRTGLLEVSYGLSKRFSFSTLITFVQQDRTAADEFIRTKGIGDVVALIKYNLIPMNAINQRTLSIGIGPKIPVGDVKLRNSGILLPEDLQPGTGAWDLIFWGYLFQGFQPKTNANLFSTFSYRISDDNYRGFRYGNEFSLTVGSSYVTTTPFDISLLLRYRNIGSYEINGNSESNTGGQWLYLLPGLNVKVSNALSFRVSGQIPIYRDLNGLQLTTSYTSSISLFYTIMKKPKLQIF